MSRREERARLEMRGSGRSQQIRGEKCGLGGRSDGGRIGVRERSAQRSNQLSAAVNAVGGMTTARDGMTSVIAPFGANTLVDDAAALGTVTNRGVGAPVIEVFTGVGSFHSDQVPCSFRSSCRKHATSIPSASQRFSKLNGHTRSVLAT